MFEIAIHTDNDAFQPTLETMHDETARILREIAARVADGAHHGNVRDANGNTVGKFEFTSP